MKWTEKQQQVIDSRNRNLLVSAAAGSGKTAVLVERIISMISEGPSPLNIDQLLVMTFTNAAASEMRERIGAAVEKKLKEDPGNEHLWLQAALIPQAQIMTIDSFCLDLIRNHYNTLDIDPAFRIGDEGELTLLKGDVMEQVLESCYEEADDSFIQFSEQFGSGKSDKAMEDVILQAWQFSQSHPWPDEWLFKCRQQRMRKRPWRTLRRKPRWFLWRLRRRPQPVFLQNDARLLWNTVFSLWETAMYTAGPIPIKEQTAPDSPLMYCAIQPVWSFPTPPDPRLSRAVRSAQQRSVRAIWYSMPAESASTMWPCISATARWYMPPTRGQASAFPNGPTGIRRRSSTSSVINENFPALRADG